MEDEVRDFILKTFGQAAAEYYDANFDPDSMIEFDGMNCGDLYDEATDAEINCSGWDGISRRCSCGNRRVYWVWNSGHLTAEAY